MWKYHKFHYRRFKLVNFVKLILIALLIFGVYLLQRSDVNPRGINSNLLGRILFSKTREESAFDREIESDLAKQVPGLCDRGVECLLSGDDVALGEDSYNANGINVMISDRISYNRKPPAVRNELCRTIPYDITKLPSTSVVIIFLDEPYSVLLRTVHSVLNTTPSRLLEEIILVDDFSTFDDLKGKLSRYVKTRLPAKVKLLRLEKQ
jgi:polypeptide N-acetylgalactosaminyltransferase